MRSSDIMSSLMELYENLKNNELFMTAIGLSGAGILTFWVKDVPKLLYQYIKKMLTIELVITNNNTVYYDFLKWISVRYPNKNFRNLRLANGRWGDDNEATTSIGYGTHYIFFNRRLFKINIQKDDADQTIQVKENVSISTFGIRKSIFDPLIHEIVNVKNDKSKKISIHKFTDHWTHPVEQNKRSIESVFIEKEKKDRIINSLNKFIQSEEWYIKNGIPYQFGILLYGPPGTGKTSLIKAISSYLDFPIYYLPSSKLYEIGNSIVSLPEKCLLVIEDIDSNPVTHSRGENDSLDLEIVQPHNYVTDDKPVVKPVKKTENNVSKYMRTTFSLDTGISDLLNSLDGMFSIHGRILIATTNHIEKLDEALIRPGRIDLRIHVGYVNHEILKDFLNNFFPNNKVVETDEFKNVEIRDRLTVAMLQEKVLEGKNEYEIMEFVKK